MFSVANCVVIREQLAEEEKQREEKEQREEAKRYIMFMFHLAPTVIM